MAVSKVRGYTTGNQSQELEGKLEEKNKAEVRGYTTGNQSEELEGKLQEKNEAEVGGYTTGNQSEAAVAAVAGVAAALGGWARRGLRRSLVAAVGRLPPPARHFQGERPVEVASKVEVGAEEGAREVSHWTGAARSARTSQSAE
jgi:uncharacterized protein YjbJ (UPF0337 family)